MKKSGNLFILFVSICLALGMAILSGCGSDSSPAPTAPATPTDITVAVADTHAAVSWTAVAGATSYNIYYGTSAGVTMSTGTKITGAVSPQVISNLTNGTPYYFVVTAVNANGESALSSETSATPAPLAKPSGISASGGDTLVTVSWSAVSGATSYNIYYGTSAGVTTSNGIKVANATSPQAVTGLTNGTPYFFVVTAANAAGESAVSSEKSATPSAAPQPPGNPTGVNVASNATGEVTVTWNAVAGATSYKVYYMTATTAPSTTEVINNNVFQSATASPLTVTGLSSGATYYFTVTAVNAGGESGGQTSPKNVLVQ